MKNSITYIIIFIFTVISWPSYCKIQPSFKSTPLSKRLREHEYSIYSLYKENKGRKSTTKNSEQERDQLYEAYNLLHTLAQDFHKPFDAPAVIVVGHQTSGKSALIEALMGFQFNQVGGGTKTRRPIALRMQYNPNCYSPMCFLTLENGKEEQRSLTDIQAYIESENKRLERDPRRSFDPREINIRMEYRYCPNMIVIDTPGMIHPPKGRQLTPQQRALALAAKEAEQLILSKIKCEDYIILCVEDTTDWKHATTRNLVMQADPQLTRTVLVTTKLDTKLPQFSEAEDLEDFLTAPLIHTLFAQILGGPFYTSVPSGRIGNSKEMNNNEDFVKRLQHQESQDLAEVMSQFEGLLSQSQNQKRHQKSSEELKEDSEFNTKRKLKHAQILQTVGVSKLRAFLETRIEECYRRNVAKIVPLLQRELHHTEQKLATIEEELTSLSLGKLKATANSYREKFAKELFNLIQGTVRISPQEHGETLTMEQAKGGHFLPSIMLSEEEHQVINNGYEEMLSHELDTLSQRLYGGAQYHRALREFTLAVRHMRSPMVTEDEIANAAGMGDVHNGVNFMRAACVIAMEKAQVSFDPMLEALKQRTEYIMKRLFPIVLQLLHLPNLTNNHTNTKQQHHALVTSFQEILRRIFERFVEEKLSDCVSKCRDDLYGMTKYVTWDVEGKSGTTSTTLYRSLPTPQRMVEIYNVALEQQTQQKTLKKHSDRSLPEEQEEEEVDEEGMEEEEVEGIQQRIWQEWSQANGNNNGKKHQKTPRNTPKTPLPSATTNQKTSKTSSSSSGSSSGSGQYSVVASTQPSADSDAHLSDYYQVMQLTEEMLSGSSASRTNALVNALVQYIISSWRNHFASAAAMKFNCFFLMPFIQEFPVYLRDELDRLYEEDLTELFDLSESRKTLLRRREELLQEREANTLLQTRFDCIAKQLLHHDSHSRGGRGHPSDGLDEVDEVEEEETATISTISTSSSKDTNNNNNNNNNNNTKKKKNPSITATATGSKSNSNNNKNNKNNSKNNTKNKNKNKKVMEEEDDDEDEVVMLDDIIGS